VQEVTCEADEEEDLTVLSGETAACNMSVKKGKATNGQRGNKIMKNDIKYTCVIYEFIFIVCGWKYPFEKK
jgi:hypothetical protein